MSKKQGRIRIGVSGWSYPGWRSRFYPNGLRQRDELAYAANRFDTIEINGTFYSLQRPEFFRAWRQSVPEDFVFAIKGSRFITHMKKLRDAEAALANFFASGVLALGDKLGPFLWQLPPRLRFEPGRLEAFLAALPRDSETAAELARRHDHRVAGRALTETDHQRPLRHAVEIRNPSFVDPGLVGLLRRQRIALVFADAVDWPYAEDLTADFVYIRLHGAEELYTSGYDAASLDHWASRIARWAKGAAPDDAVLITPDQPAPHAARDVYVYFDNDAKVRAPFDAQALRALVFTANQR